MGSEAHGLIGSWAHSTRLPMSLCAYEPVRLSQHPVLGLFHDVVHYVFQIAALAEDPELAVGAGSVLHDLTSVVDLVARAELVADVVDEFEQFIEQQDRKSTRLNSSHEW